MKANRFLLWCIAFMAFIAIQANAITFEEIAGTYIGWRAITTPAGTTLFKEFDQILPDGTIDTSLMDENGNVRQFSSILTLDKDGNITGSYAGILNIHGGNLIINYRPDADNAVQVMAKRFEGSFTPPNADRS